LIPQGSCRVPKSDSDMNMLRPANGCSDNVQTFLLLSIAPRPGKPTTLVSSVVKRARIYELAHVHIYFWLYLRAWKTECW
jgi:hypothetical protein